MRATWVKRSLNVGALTAGALLVSGAAAQAGGDLADDARVARDTGAELPIQLPISVCDDLAAVAGLADKTCPGGASALPPEWTNAHFLSGGRPLADLGSARAKPMPPGAVAPAIPSDRAPALLGDSVPTLLNDGVPALLEDRVPALLRNGVPALLEGEVPALVTNGVPTLLTDEVPTLATDEVSTLVSDELPTLLTDEVPTLLTEEVPALLADEVSALLGNGADGLLGDGLLGDGLLGNGADGLLGSGVDGLLGDVLGVLGDGTDPAPAGATPDDTTGYPMGDQVGAGLGDLGSLDVASPVFAPAQVLIDICGNAIGLLEGSQTGCAGGVAVIR